MDDRVWQETAVPPVFGKEIETRIVKPTSNAGVGFFLSQSCHSLSNMVLEVISRKTALKERRERGDGDVDMTE